MRERTEEIGGRFDVRSRSDRSGTTVHTRLPVGAVPSQEDVPMEAVHA
jgi:signal transduction histidine kinase